MRKYMLVAMFVPTLLIAQVPATPPPITLNVDIVLWVGIQSCTFPYNTPRPQLMRGIDRCLNQYDAMLQTMRARGMRGAPAPADARGRGNGMRGRGMIASTRPQRIITGKTFLPVADVPAQYLSSPDPIYPEELLSKKVAGQVILQFVVDVTGNVDASTIKIISATHPAFGASAITMVKASKYSPAKNRGVVVRQEVVQTIKFTI